MHTIVHRTFCAQFELCKFLLLCAKLHFDHGVICQLWHSYGAQHPLWSSVVDKMVMVFFYWHISWFLFITIICDVWGCLGMMWLLPPSKFRINGLNPWNVNMPCEYESSKKIILLHGDRKYFLEQIYPASFLFKILELLQTRWSHENPYFPIILPIKSTLSLSLFQW